MSAAKFAGLALFPPLPLLGDAPRGICSEAVDPEALAGRVRLQREIAGHLLALPEPYRTAVVLRYQDGLRPVEIAARLAIGEAAARQRISRGLAQLRERLAAEFRQVFHGLRNPVLHRRAEPGGAVEIEGGIAAEVVALPFA